MTDDIPDECACSMHGKESLRWDANLKHRNERYLPTVSKPTVSCQVCNEITWMADEMNVLETV